MGPAGAGLLFLPAWAPRRRPGSAPGAPGEARFRSPASRNAEALEKVWASANTNRPLYLRSGLSVPSGSFFCNSLLDFHWKPNMTEAEALTLMDLCIKELHTRFMISMPNWLIKVADKDGVRLVRGGKVPS